MTIKRILFISHMYPTKSNMSYGKVIHEQAISLINKGYEIKVISPIPYIPKILSNHNKRFNNYYKTSYYENYEGIDVYYPRYLSVRRNPFLFYLSADTMYLSILKLIDDLHKRFKFDIIHSHFGYPDAYIGQRLARKYDVKLISTIQATDLDITVNLSDKIKRRLFNGLNKSHTVITPSPKISKQLRELLEIKSETIGYGINSQKICNKFEKKTIFSGKEDKEIQIVSISRLINTKGIDYNIEAVKKLKEENIYVKYTVIGDGIEKENLMNLTKELNLDDSVTFLGALSNDDAIAVLKKSDMFLLPSWQETFGLVYLEAMANNIPVIGCKGQGFDGIILQDVNGYLAEPKNSDSIVEIIKYMINNEKKVEKIIKNANKLVKNNYTMETIAESISEIYERGFEA